MDTENKHKKNLYQSLDHFCMNILPFVIVYELVLGGSGRTIMFGKYISLRYLLFFFAMLYFLVVVLRDLFAGKLTLKGMLRQRMNRTLALTIIFFAFYLFAIGNGINNGYAFSDVFESSKGLLYILMVFPFSVFVDSKVKARKLVRAFINSAVIVAVMTFVIFIIYGINVESYNFFGYYMNKLNYGYMAYRGGYPAVFLKTSPYMGIALIYELNMYMNSNENRSNRTIFNIFILLEGIMCTMSMGIWIASVIGFVLVVIISVVNRKNLKEKDYMADFKRLLPVVLVVVATQFIFNQVFNNYIGNVIENRFSPTDISYVVKSDQLIKLTDLWLDNIFLGKGFGISIIFELGDHTQERMILFELFWNQLLMNMGILGAASYLLLIFEPVLRFLRDMFKKRYKTEDVIFILSLSVGIFMMCIVSSVNPFMNNPIGIGFLVLVLSTINVFSKKLS